jgi:chemotaxis protein methyltransferase CheR
MKHLTDEEWKLLSDLISEHFGLVFPTTRRALLEHRLRARLERLHLNTFAEYYRYLVCHPERHIELRELPMLITNNETYFFREAHQFRLLTKHLLPELGPKLRARPLRILSAGCSSGDEVYSIVISLYEWSDNLAGGNWLVDACDLNRARLMQAREALYEPNHLRACDEVMRSTYFDNREGRFALRKKFLTGTRFFELNLASATMEFPGAPYDIIFCRNVLIYFSNPAFDALITRFHEALADHGYLFLGHAESLIGRRDDFRPVRFQGSIVYEKVPAEKPRRAGAGAAEAASPALAQAKR